MYQITTPKAAILYDFLQVKGGAEKVSLGACKQFPNLDLIVSFINQTIYTNEIIEETRLRVLGSFTNVSGWQTIKSSFLFKYKTSFISNYDVLIFSGSNAPLAIQNSRAKKNIYYCHTPPRFIYDLKDYYLDTVPLWQKPFLKALIAYLQPRYEDSLSRMDIIYANSKNVKDRLKKYLSVNAKVLYPPTELNDFVYRSSQDYFLSTARLEEYKRVDVIIDAFKNLPEKKLVVASGGSLEPKLRHLAAGCPNIEFTGWTSEAKMRELVGNCAATIYVSKDEDFGMSPVESMAAGKPVIGVDQGGIAETIIHGKTGWLLDERCATDDMIALVKSLKLSDIVAMKKACEERAKCFNEESFYDEIGSHLGPLC